MNCLCVASYYLKAPTASPTAARRVSRTAGCVSTSCAPAVCTTGARNGVSPCTTVCACCEFRLGAAPACAVRTSNFVHRLWTRNRSAHTVDTAELVRGDDLDVDVGPHIRMQPPTDTMRADGLDGVGQFDASPVEVRAAGRLDRLGHIGCSHGAEQPATVAGSTRQRDPQAAESGRDVLRL